MSSPGKTPPAPVDVLPHRPPFLLVDEIVGMEVGRRIEGRWRPGADVPVVDVGLGSQVPASLVVEAIAQLGAYGAIMWSPDRSVYWISRPGEISSTQNQGVRRLGARRRRRGRRRGGRGASSR